MSLKEETSRFVMCMDCKHVVWPPASLGECRHPDAFEVLTTEARNTNGVCGAAGKLYERKNDEANY